MLYTRLIALEGLRSRACCANRPAKYLGSHGMPLKLLEATRSQEMQCVAWW